MVPGLASEHVKQLSSGSSRIRIGQNSQTQELPGRATGSSSGSSGSGHQGWLVSRWGGGAWTANKPEAHLLDGWLAGRG